MHARVHEHCHSVLLKGLVVDFRPSAKQDPEMPGMQNGRAPHRKRHWWQLVCSLALRTRMLPGAVAGSEPPLQSYCFGVPWSIM